MAGPVRHLYLAIRHDGLTVPAAVVQRGPQGTYAYVIKPASTVQMRPITVAQLRDGALAPANASSLTVNTSCGRAPTLRSTTPSLRATSPGNPDPPRASVTP